MFAFKLLHKLQLFRIFAVVFRKGETVKIYMIFAAILPSVIIVLCQTSVLSRLPVIMICGKTIHKFSFIICIILVIYTWLFHLATYA